MSKAEAGKTIRAAKYRAEKAVPIVNDLMTSMATARDLAIQAMNELGYQESGVMDIAVRAGRINQLLMNALHELSVLDEQANQALTRISRI